VASMTSAVSIGCPICLGKGTNVRQCCAVKSLTGDPRFAAIADDWDPTNSGQPETYYPRSNHVVKWKHIGVCGCVHEWENPIYKRILGALCPYCSKQKPGKVCCDYGTISTMPKIMALWDFEKNYQLHLEPNTLLASSNVNAYWTCKHTCSGQVDCRHEW